MVSSATISGTTIRSAWLGTVLLAVALPVIAPTSQAPTGAASPTSLPQYAHLLLALERYRVLASDASLAALPPLPRPVSAGDAYAGVPQLRRLLVAVGDMDPQASDPRDEVAATYPGIVIDALSPPRPDTFTETLAGTLRRFQKRHGLSADGVLGTATWRALTTPMSTRVRQIERALAAWESLPPNPHRRALFVSIPQFQLFGLEDMRDPATPAIEMDVIVGQATPSQRTPAFVADMTHVVFSPWWEVPQSIAMEELLPKLRADENYALKHGYEILASDGERLAPDKKGLAAVEAGAARLRQRPGKGNALGTVKFMLPNEHNVYLHDTSADPALFTHRRRAFSHGCVRVADPAALARFVLKDDPHWSDAAIEAAMAANKSLQVDLAEPIRVYIMYATASASAGGTVQFHDDVYGLEAGS